MIIFRLEHSRPPKKPTGRHSPPPWVLPKEEPVIDKLRESLKRAHSNIGTKIENLPEWEKSPQSFKQINRVHNALVTHYALDDIGIKDPKIRAQVKRLMRQRMNEAIEWTRRKYSGRPLPLNNEMGYVKEIQKLNAQCADVITKAKGPEAAKKFFGRRDEHLKEVLTISDEITGKSKKWPPEASPH